MKVQTPIQTRARKRLARRRSRCRASVLLEVILALVLLVAAAAIIGSGMSSSVEAVERQRLKIHAANLASTVLAEFELGLKSPGNGPETFLPPFDHWSWELQLAPVESDLDRDASLTLAEAVIRHDDPPLVHRLAQILPAETARRSTELSPAHTP